MSAIIGRRTGPMVVRSGLGESRLWDDCQQRTLASLVGASWARPSIVWWEKGFPWVGMASNGQWNGPQPYQSRDKLGFPGPAPGQVQGELAGLAGDPSSQGEEASPKGLGGCHPLSQSDALGPAGQIVGHDLHRQPGSVGGEAPRGEMVEAHAVLQVPDGVLDLGVAAVVGLQFQGVPVAVSDEGVIAVVGKEGQLGAWGGPHPADDEPHRRGAGLTLERSVSSLGHIGPTLHPVGDGPPVRLGYGLYQVAQALAQADGDGEADVRLAADLGPRSGYRSRCRPAP